MHLNAGSSQSFAELAYFLPDTWLREAGTMALVAGSLPPDRAAQATTPLAMLAMQNDGVPYLRTADAACLIGIVGLDELVRIRRGQSLHESEQALDFGLAIVGRLREEADDRQTEDDSEE